MDPLARIFGALDLHRSEAMHDDGLVPCDCGEILASREVWVKEGPRVMQGDLFIRTHDVTFCSTPMTEDGWSELMEHRGN